MTISLFLLALFILVCLLLLLSIAHKVRYLKTPLVNTKEGLALELIKKENSTHFGSTFIHQNKFGIYELFTEGAPFERGFAIGRVSEEIKKEHEKNFIESISKIVPSPFRLKLLKIVVGILNRNLASFFKPAYLEELYGLSFSSPNEFDYIAPKYQRVLNYHAAHDIGHALQNMGLVGCSSFVVTNNKSADKTLLLARNLDFSPSEKFNKLKVLYFIAPNNAYKYISYSWPGFIGVVSGMNEWGLCVVIHSSKSKFSFSIGTPVSIIVKEILESAKNIDEARQILNKRTSYVSELFFVVSSEDKSAIVFEKEPKSLTEYALQNNQLICVNHLMSEERKNTEENLAWKKTISSAYREERLLELLSKYEHLAPFDAASILRNIKGCKEENIGLQNENAINQLNAHHGIIFKPESKEFWVSSSHYMLGTMVAYQFDEAFEKATRGDFAQLYQEEKNIPADELLKTEEYELFENYKKLKKIVLLAIENKEKLSDSVLASFKASNEQLFYTHEILGDYYWSQNEKNLAKKHFQLALNLNIPTSFEKSRIIKKWTKS